MHSGHCHSSSNRSPPCFWISTYSISCCRLNYGFHNLLRCRPRLPGFHRLAFCFDRASKRPLCWFVLWLHRSECECFVPISLFVDRLSCVGTVVFPKAWALVVDSPDYSACWTFARAMNAMYANIRFETGCGRHSIWSFWFCSGCLGWTKTLGLLDG